MTARPFSLRPNQVMSWAGEARVPQAAPTNARPVFAEVAQIGRQTHYKERADKVLAKSDAQTVVATRQQKPYVEVRTDPATNKRIVTAKFGDKTFEFNKVYTADEITGGMASIKAKLRSNPHAMGMERVEGVSGAYYTDIKNVPKGYRSALNEATSV